MSVAVHRVPHVSALRGIADPFGEQPVRVFRTRRSVLGADIEFIADSRALLRLAEDAYRGLPRHRLSTGVRRLCIRLRLAAEGGIAQRDPPRMRMHGGNGFLCGVLDANNFAIVSPASGGAVVVISRSMLRHTYHARYELLEFAVYTLAARTQGLVSLHAGCLGADGRGVLVIGRSGAGKSTLALHAMLDGLELLSEDSVFVAPKTLLATGVGTFVHVRTDAPALGNAHDRWIRNSRVIRRRSGIEKFEVDVRRPPGRIAPKALKIRAVVFVSSRRVRDATVLVPLPRRDAVRRLTASQAYAAGQAQWKEFVKRAACLPAFELRRGDRPETAVSALRELL